MYFNGREARVRLARSWPARVGLAAGIVLLTTAVARADAGGGSLTGAFANLEPGGRGAALGGALGPVVDDATAIHWNPARLLEIDGRAISATYADLFGLHLARHASFFLALPRHEREVSWNRGAVSVRGGELRSVLGFGMQSIRVDLDPESYAEYDLALAYARHGPWGLAWGLTGHALLVRSDLEGVSASGFAGDLALSRSFGPRLQGSLVVRSLFSNLSWKNKTGKPLTRTVEIGLGACPHPQLVVPVTVTLDLERGALQQAASGVEWRPVGPTLTLRGGLRWRDDGERRDLRGGGGIGLGWKGIVFDYGLAMGPSELGETHRFSLHFGF